MALELSGKNEEVRAEALRMIARDRCLDTKSLDALCRDMQLAADVRAGNPDRTKEVMFADAAALTARGQPPQDPQVRMHGRAGPELLRARVLPTHRTSEEEPNFSAERQ